MGGTTVFVNCNGVQDSQKIVFKSVKGFRTPTLPPPNFFFLNTFTLISVMIKISCKMAEFSQLAENLEPWKLADLKSMHFYMIFFQ